MRRTLVLAALLVVFVASGCATVAAHPEHEWPSIEDERQHTEWFRVARYERVPGHENPYAALLDLDSAQLRERLGPPHGWGGGRDHDGRDRQVYDMVWRGACCMGGDFNLLVILRPRTEGAPPLEWRSVAVHLFLGCDGRSGIASDITGYTGPWRQEMLWL